MPLILLFLSIFLGTYFKKKKVIYSSLVLFYIISTPFFSENFFKVVEGQYIKLEIEKINEVDAANKAFEDLMGGETDARKKFIAENSLKVANLDI